MHFSAGLKREKAFPVFDNEESIKFLTSLFPLPLLTGSKSHFVDLTKQVDDVGAM